MNIFAARQPLYSTFKVKNIISKDNRTIKVFQYPIPVGYTRDLLQIPGIAESDIRASLLKGELLTKLLAKELIIVESDIDLLQFNASQLALLQNYGLSISGQIDINNITPALNSYISSGGSGGISAAAHETLRQLIHFIDEGPGDGFVSGAYKVILNQPFPTNITWYTDNTISYKIIEKLITYNTSSVPIVITWNVYNTDGITVAHSLTDTITYTNSIETSRTRSIS